MRTFREYLKESRGSPIRTYRDLAVGNGSVPHFFLYELLTCLLGPLPGGGGLLLRKIFYPGLFQNGGTGLIIGRNVVFRHPEKISIGNNVTIDDNCLVDARGAGAEGIVLEEEVIINRNCIIQARSGPIRMGHGTSLGSNSVVVSWCGIDIGEKVLAAGGIYISAGAYHFDDPAIAVMDQGSYTKGPIHIGGGCWLGTRAVILDGVNIGDGAVIGAGAVVTKDLPEYSIAAGVPAKIKKTRDKHFSGNR